MSKSDIHWEADALAKINKAPFFIRSFAKKKVETAARDRGLSTITLEFMEKVRQKEMEVV